MTLSYFTGEQHSENYEQIIQLAKELGFSVQVYESNESSQFDFLQAVYRDTATIVDATIPDDLTLSTVYPILTAHVNILDHILVFSDKQYDDGTQILPLNICPQRSMSWHDKNFLKWLYDQLEDLKEHQYYERIEIESVEKLLDYKFPMEKVMSASLELHKPKKGNKKRVTMSYRDSYSQEVARFMRREEAKGEVEIKVLPPGSLCDDYEVLTPMRKWMLAGVMENHIRNVDEVWVYYTDDYVNSWWTLDDMVMVAYINHDREEKDKIQIRVYDSQKQRFMEGHEVGYPAFLYIQLSDLQHQKISRLLSNTRPNAYDDSFLSLFNNQIQYLDIQQQKTLSSLLRIRPRKIDFTDPKTVRKMANLLLNTRPGKMDFTAPQAVSNLKKMAWELRFMTKKKRFLLFEQLRPIIELSVPSDLRYEERDKMVNDLLAMYSDPRAIMAYTKDDVFKETFWNNISYQTDYFTPAYRDGYIDVDFFIDTPMRELTQFDDEILRPAIRDDKAIMLKGQRYYVREGKTRYFWVPTHNGAPSVKDAPGIKIAQTYYWTPLAYFIFDKNDCDKAQIVSKQLGYNGITFFKDDWSEIGDGNESAKFSHDYLINCKIVIVLLSAANAESQGVMKKIEFAKKLGKNIIPIIVDYKSLPRELIRLLGGFSFWEWKADAKEFDEMIMHALYSVLGESTDKHLSFFIKEKAIDYEIKALDNYFPQENEYKIFISYRRDGGVDLARSIKQQLQILGYDNIFFDYNSIRDGVFNTQILDAIYSCNVFLLILTPKSMNRCANKGDWVAREIRTALKYNRRIIPIRIENEFTWPLDFPNDMNKLKGFQQHKLFTDEYFEHSIELLSKRIDMVNPRNHKTFYKIKVDKRCRMKIDDEEFQVLEATKLTKVTLPEGNYIRKDVDFEDEKLFKDYVLVFDQEKMS